MYSVLYCIRLMNETQSSFIVHYGREPWMAVAVILVSVSGLGVDKSTVDETLSASFLTRSLVGAYTISSSWDMLGVGPLRPAYYQASCNPFFPLYFVTAERRNCPWNFDLSDATL